MFQKFKEHVCFALLSNILYFYVMYYSSYIIHHVLFVDMQCLSLRNAIWEVAARSAQLR